MQEFEFDGVEISQDTPLISNLDIKENIALIKEVHEKKERQSAEKEAVMMLDKLGMKHISNLRKNSCSGFEILCAMVARAFMCKENSIVVKMPFGIDNSLNDIDRLFEKIYKLNGIIEKKVTVFDLDSNRYRYERAECNILK